MFDHELNALAFPKLDKEQLTGMEECPLTKLKHYHQGDKLIASGQRDWNFYVVKGGEIEILDESGDAPKTITYHGPGEFTGDVDQLTGKPAIFSAVARQDSDVYEISPDALKLVLNHHPSMGDMILQAFLSRRHLLRDSGTFIGLRVLGSSHLQDTFRVRDFLSKNRVPHTWLDLDADPQVKELMQRFGVSETDTPVVAWGQKLLLRNPSTRQLADVLGLRRTLEQKVYDLVVVGAGPAGLAAAVYGASEGLSTIVLERIAPGGQAGRSMRIENYLGFPTGISGSELAERAVLQANKFGARLPVGTQVLQMTFDGAFPVIHVDGGEKVSAKCLLIATGADYRLLNVEGCAQFEGRGVYYAATSTEALMCRGSDVLVVGGGNSAGQAAVFLAGQVRKVYLVIRGDDLYKNMSSYLARRLELTPNIEILRNTEVRRMAGDGSLAEVELINNKTGAVLKLQAPAVFSFIGATPRTEWLPPEIEKDDKSFVRTGPTLAQSSHWTARRQPFLLETSRPGVFAAGDVRSGSIKRVASAVGEGAMAVQFVHEYMKEL